MKRIMQASVRLAQGALGALFGLCHFMPRQKRIVFLSRQSNSAPLDFVLLAEQIRRDHPDYETVILAKKLEGKVPYMAHMVKQVYYLATSRAAVLDSYCIAVSMLAERLRIPVLQMWHALGLMKQAGYAALGDPDGRDEETASLFHMHEGYSSVLVSSARFRDDFARTFNVDPAIIYEAPLPRVDQLTSFEIRARKRAELETAFPQLSQRKNVVYCPTFRKTYSSKDREAVAELVDACDAAGLNFVYKPHPVSTLRLDDPRVVQDETGRYDLLFAADYVVTDYSTIMYEAGLMGVAVFLYAYDWDDYRQRRSFEIDIKQEVPAFFSESAQLITDAMKCGNFDQGAFQSFVARYIALPEGQSCTQRIEDHLFSLIESEKGEGIVER